MKKFSSFITSKKLHVFIADDDPEDIEFFRSALREASAEIKITTARDGMELIDFLDVVIPDMIFLDINMPCMNGIDCLTHIRSRAKLDKVPVIIYSTSADKKHIDATYELGANLYIRKPSRYTEIKDRLNKTLSLSLSDLLPQPSKEKYVLDLYN